MSEIQPGPDEIRIRHILKKRGVGPAGDWWAPKPDAPIVEDEPEPEAEEEQPDRPPVFAPEPGYWPRPHMPAVITNVPARAEAAISPGTRRFLYNATAAGAGWMLGLYSKFAWALDDCGHQEGADAALILGVGGAALIAHVWDRRTRHWWPGIAWCARIPLATALLALALWAPAAP